MRTLHAPSGRVRHLPARLQADGGRVDAQRHVGEEGEQVHVREGLLGVDKRQREPDGTAASVTRSAKV